MSFISKSLLRVLYCHSGTICGFFIPALTWKTDQSRCSMGWPIKTGYVTQVGWYKPACVLAEESSSIGLLVGYTSLWIEVYRGQRLWLKCCSAQTCLCSHRCCWRFTEGLTGQQPTTNGNQRWGWLPSVGLSFLIFKYIHRYSLFSPCSSPFPLPLPSSLPPFLFPSLSPSFPYSISLLLSFSHTFYISFPSPPPILPPSFPLSLPLSLTPLPSLLSPPPSPSFLPFLPPSLPSSLPPISLPLSSNWCCPSEIWPRFQLWQWTRRTEQHISTYIVFMMPMGTELTAY